MSRKKIILTILVNKDNNMIVNGQFVKYDEKGAVAIQEKINSLEKINADLKGDINPKELITNDQDIYSDLMFSNSSMTNEQLNKKGAPWFVMDRKQWYGIATEMDSMEFIHRALEIVADDSCQMNTEGNVLKINTNDDEKKKILEDLFIERLDMNSELWNIVFDTARFGDNFYEIVPDSYDHPKRIVYLKYLEPYRVVRVEKNNRLSHFEYKSFEDRNAKEDQNLSRSPNTQRDTEATEKIYKLQPWQVVHFKVNDDKTLAPYGASLLKPGFNTWKKLVMLEDIMVVYRIARAPERRVFYIDVGNMNKTDAQKFMTKIKNSYRNQSVLDENGNFNYRNNILSTTSDIFVPVKEGGKGTKIETLQGGNALSDTKDMDYFKDKILRTMNIPSSYLGDSTDRSRGSLAQLDSKFARFIERIQNQIRKGLYKIASIELFFNNYKKEELKEFTIEMTTPSNIKEVSDIEIMTGRMNLISTIQQLNIFSNQWILKNIMKLSQKEINDILFQQKVEKATSDPEAAGMNGGMPGLGGMNIPMGGTPGEMPPAEGGEMPEMPGEMPETPPAEGGEMPEMPAGTPPEENVSASFIDYFPKEYLTENKTKNEQFIALYNYIKEEQKRKTPIFAENLSKLLNEDFMAVKEIPTNSISEQFITGEFKGLIWSEKPEKSGILLFEKNNNEKVSISYLKG